VSWNDIRRALPAKKKSSDYNSGIALTKSEKGQKKEGQPPTWLQYFYPSRVIWKKNRGETNILHQTGQKEAELQM
jgi:hypothetical protein